MDIIYSPANVRCAQRTQKEKKITNKQQLKGVYKLIGANKCKEKRLDDKSIVLFKGLNKNQKKKIIKMFNIFQITRMTCVVLCIRTRSCWLLEKPEAERVHKLLNTSWRQVTLEEVL